MKHWIFGAASILIGLSLLMHTEPAATRIQSNTLVIDQSAGTYRETSRSPPSSDARMYWADAMNGSIKSSALDGTATAILVDDVGIPYGMAFDADTQALLWTNAAAEIVQKVAVSGGMPITLTTSFEEPYAIDISTETEQAYYSATANVVYRNGYDPETGGESSAAILTLSDTEAIHGLALDTTNGILYIGDENGRMSRKLVLAGQIEKSLPHTDTELSPDSSQPDKIPPI